MTYAIAYNHPCALVTFYKGHRPVVIFIYYKRCT